MKRKKNIKHRIFSSFYRYNQGQIYYETNEAKISEIPIPRGMPEVILLYTA